MSRKASDKFRTKIARYGFIENDRGQILPMMRKKVTETPVFVQDDGCYAIVKAAGSVEMVKEVALVLLSE